MVSACEIVDITAILVVMFDIRTTSVPQFWEHLEYSGKRVFHNFR